MYINNVSAKSLLTGRSLNPALKQNFYTRLWKRGATAKVHDGKMTKQSLVKRFGRDVKQCLEVKRCVAKR